MNSKIYHAHGLYLKLTFELEFQEGGGGGDRDRDAHPLTRNIIKGKKRGLKLYISPNFYKK